MIAREHLYRSILSNLSVIPVEYLQQIDVFLKEIAQKPTQKEESKANILSFAGSWSDMPERDFEDFMEEIRRTKDGMFKDLIDI